MIEFKTYFAKELEALKETQSAGMVELQENGLQVTDMGWFFVRAVAMQFDRYLQTDRTRAKFSKII
jgi:oxygen-independent coproporphyrinogen-3 oxidase